MAANYTEVSTLVGDPTNALIGTAQIATLAGLYGEESFTLGAASARYIAASFANSVNKKAGDVSIDASDKFKHFTALADKLEKEASRRSLGATSVYAGGISQSDKTTRENDSDRSEPYFTRTLHDDPGRDDDELDGDE